jgi:dolichol-phosphate mannosyltransferase
MDRSVSVIVPALNEEGNLAGTIAAVLAEIEGKLDRFEILIFDDASTDRTGAIADALGASRPEIRVVHNPRTRGLGYNYRAGVELATCDYVVMVPGDNEVTREALSAMFDSIGTADIIAPYFTNSSIRPKGRQIVSRLFTGLVNRIVGVNLRYFNGPCIHRRDLALAAMPATDGFAYMAVLLARLMSSGFSVREIAVPLGPRASGGSKAFRFKNVVSVVAALAGLFVELRVMRRRWEIPATMPPRVTGD